MVSESSVDADEGPGGVTVEVIVAAVFFSVSFGLVVVLSSRLSPEPGVVLALAGWPIFALAGGVLLDQRPSSLVGRTLTSLSLFPLLVFAWTAARFGDLSASDDLMHAMSELGGVQVLAVCVAIPWAVRAPDDTLAAATLVVGAIGALVILIAEPGGLSGTVELAGWIAVVVGCAGVDWQVALAAASDDRATQRRVTLLLGTLASASAVVGAAVLLLAPTVVYVVIGSVVALTALAVARLSLIAYFRPLDEHALDLGLVVATVGVAAIMAFLVGLGAGITRLPSSNTSAGFTALVTAALTLPAALWVRRGALARRYGNGIIAPSDVALITADLHAQTEPRDLLDKAARMVATASGSTQARIVLGEDSPVVPERWDLHPLVVGPDRVGALLIESRGTEGPELRQQNVIAQLLPTVALVARAVGLAVEAEHARRDVARELDAERARILGDLHDGLGPVLAGMSMRVQASLRASPPSPHAELMADLAAGLATSRTDLRRIVAGIKPSALDDGDLEAALERLVDSFRSAVSGPQVALKVALDTPLPGVIQVAVYRSVAEGVTNALRHARATSITVDVSSDDHGIAVVVDDDGRGGPVAPGVGLSSLAQRAETLGGHLDVGSRDQGGTRLRLRLPVDERVDS